MNNTSVRVNVRVNGVAQSKKFNHNIVLCIISRSLRSADTLSSSPKETVRGGSTVRGGVAQPGAMTAALVPGRTVCAPHALEHWYTMSKQSGPAVVPSCTVGAPRALEHWYTMSKQSA